MNAETKFVAGFIANDESAFRAAWTIIDTSKGKYEAAARLLSFYCADFTVSTGARDSSVMFTRLLRETIAKVDWIQVVQYLLD